MRVACVSMVRDESLFLAIWYRYYGRLFGAENLFLIDHCSAETKPREYLAQFPDGEKVNVIRIPYDTPARNDAKGHFDMHRFAFLSHFMNSLLKYFDIVIYGDADEIYLANPDVATDLSVFLEHKYPFDACAGIGIELLHDHACEPSLDPSGTILSQRRKFVYRVSQSKPHILAKATRIRAHGINQQFTVDPDLYLVHLKYVDREALTQRQRFLNSLYRQGHGALSRWRFNERQIGDSLDELLKLPVSNEALLPSSTFSARNSKLNEKRGVHEIMGAFTPKERAQIESELHLLPESFSGIF